MAGVHDTIVQMALGATASVVLLMIFLLVRGLGTLCALPCARTLRQPALDHETAWGV